MSAAVANLSIHPNLRLGPYVLGTMLGKGGMGIVYEAQHQALKKRVAVKFLNPDASSSADAVERFVREGEAAARVKHPNVVEVYDVGIHEGLPYLVMEFLEGEDLEKKLAARKKLSPSETIDLLLPVLSAIQTVHNEGVIHRDLKPGNVFLAKQRTGRVEPKVLDFGISKLADGQAKNLTSTASMLGTPYYMSPEQAKGAKFVGPRADQYSLGVILYECLTGQRPFEHDTLFGIIQLIVCGEYRPLREVAPEIPAELARAVEQAMSTNEEGRHESVAHFALALLPFASPSARTHWEHAFHESIDRTRVELSSTLLSDDFPRSGEHETREASNTPLQPIRTPPTEVDRPPGSAVAASASSASTPGSMLRADENAGMPATSGTRTRWLPFGLGLGAAGAAMFGVALFLSKRSGDVEPNHSGAPVSVISSPRPTETFRVLVVVEPSSATYELDGDAPRATPVRLELTKDGSPHVLRFVAPGFRPRIVSFTDEPPPAIVELEADPGVTADPSSPAPASSRIAPSRTPRPAIEPASAETPAERPTTTSTPSPSTPPPRTTANMAIIIAD